MSEIKFNIQASQRRKHVLLEFTPDSRNSRAQGNGREHAETEQIVTATVDEGSDI